MYVNYSLLAQTALLTLNHLVTASPPQPFPPSMTISAKVSGEAEDDMLMPGDSMCTIHARTLFLSIVYKIMKNARGSFYHRVLSDRSYKKEA